MISLCNSIHFLGRPIDDPLRPIGIHAPSVLAPDYLGILEARHAEVNFIRDFECPGFLFYTRLFYTRLSEI